MKKPIIKEFSLCDYYLVRGMAKAFKVYPFVKKRGRATEAVGNCVFEYDEDKKAIILGNDCEKNHDFIYNDMSQLEKVPLKQMNTSKCLQFEIKKHKKCYSV